MKTILLITLIMLAMACPSIGQDGQNETKDQPKAKQGAPAPPESLAELRTTDGKIYRTVTVTGVTPSALKIMHADGIATVPLAKLPPELQNKYGYDSAAADADLKKRADAQREAQRGIADERRELACKEWMKKHTLYVEITVSQVINGREALCFWQEVRKGDPQLGEDDLMLVGSKSAEMIFVESLNHSIVAGSVLHLGIYPIGRLHYTNALKAFATVSRYTTRLDYASTWLHLMDKMPAGEGDRTIPQGGDKPAKLDF